MVAVPIPRSVESTPMRSPQTIASHSLGSASLSAPAADTKSQDWAHFVTASAVVAGGALMVTGHRRAGLAVAAAGTAIALLEEQDAVATWWKNLPEYLNQAQDFLDKVEHYLGEATVQGQRLQSILRR